MTAMHPCYGLWLLTRRFADIDMIAMFENAYKQQPNNEELGAQTFFANVRTGNWKTAQQVRSKIFALQRRSHNDLVCRWPLKCTNSFVMTDFCTGV